MTDSKRAILAEEPIIWTGDLSDNCTAKWAGLMLKAEWMEKNYWWWAVYDMEKNEETIDSSNHYDTKFTNGKVAREKAESIAREFLGSL